jgi:hypothetical protein
MQWLKYFMLEYKGEYTYPQPYFHPDEWKWLFSLAKCVMTGYAVTLRIESTTRTSPSSPRYWTGTSTGIIPTTLWTVVRDG